MKAPLHLAATLALVFTTALATPLHAAEGDKVRALVNGKPITQEMLDVYRAQRARRSHQGHGHEIDEQTALQELINVELMLQDAERKKLDQRPEVKRELDWHRRGVLVSLGMREYLEQNPVTEADLKAAYEKRKAAHPGKEYKARHILVKSEEEAKAIIAELEKGADFAELAKRKSTGPTGKNGGDLGWFSPDQMVPEFGTAVQKLKKGEFSRAPVKTQFGWHVILLEDMREVPPPDFESLKPELQARLQNARIDAFLKGLRDKAKIEIK